MIFYIQIFLIYYIIALVLSAYVLRVFNYGIIYPEDQYMISKFYILCLFLPLFWVLAFVVLTSRKLRTPNILDRTIEKYETLFTLLKDEEVNE